MSVRLDDAEVQAFLGEAHTGILATLRADGSPAVMPLWFVVIDGDVVVRTRAGSAKAKHVERDPRVSFLVESGRAWAELRAVVLYGRAVVEADPELTARVDDAFGEKYAAFLMPEATPDSTRRHYAAERAHIRVVPDRKSLTWDNAKLLKRRP